MLLATTAEHGRELAEHTAACGVYHKTVDEKLSGLQDDMTWAKRGLIALLLTMLFNIMLHAFDISPRAAAARAPQEWHQPL